MEYEMNHVVFKEMFYVTGGCIPLGAEALTEAAHQSKEVAAVLPFYMYCFYPREWQEYTLFTEDPLPSALNHAAHVALEAHGLPAGKKIKRYFYGASAIAPLPEKHPTAVSMKEWTSRIHRQYQSLRQKASILESRADSSRPRSREWFVTAAGKGTCYGAHENESSN
ncbi:hypothetical protein [Marinococcus luteus]|uniref:hypothetical protein n=1 Tax=Marinococcus luteus TaxID=1122204 RepID=UPI002ACD0C09|nr:hypothetical protein [Marinococcus luteus]MDZ5781934.1 hypothetical protein [Marinococcus luteus]